MDPADDSRLTTLDDAISDQNITAVQRLLAQHADLETRDQIGATPLIAACSSGQFRVAELLIQAGADVLASSPYGVTAGEQAWISKVKPASDEGRARERVLAVMRDRGFPFPPPPRPEIVQMLKAGTWPPRAAPPANPVH